jgi:1-acyl-sn-glycerol-3-phosphate acyltransferase
MDRVRAVVASVVLPAALMVTAALALVVASIGGPSRWIDGLYRRFARLCLRVGGTEVDVYGYEHIDEGTPYVIVPNHESLWDPMVLVAALDRLHVRFVVKEAVARMPVVGPALLRTGNVAVRRVDTAGDVARLRAGMACRAPETSMLFFAEGTRSRDGKLHPFKKGAFATALATGLPILPIAIAGSGAVLPPDTLALRARPVIVEIGRPILPGGGTIDGLCAATHAAVRALRLRARERLRFIGARSPHAPLPPLRRPSPTPALPLARAGSARRGA